ncbi:hypothetical protein BpHYR1_052164 [Brachionus plicatilis]|uniref:Uncharacterized protein n=1 Tax=Brachionus plicatilis TaxID=10195 RepID=A0A3M7R4F7_BRAPC|nr:hypothetical protein BpHYR1_052164 [Brachionus plicatilis]
MQFSGMVSKIFFDKFYTTLALIFNSIKTSKILFSNPLGFIFPRIIKPQQYLNKNHPVNSYEFNRDYIYFFNYAGLYLIAETIK